MKITFAAQDAVDQFQDQVDLLLNGLGHPEALVTDESQVSDFLPWTCAEFSAEDLALAQAEERRCLDSLGQLMGREVLPRERLWEMARDLYHAQKQTQALTRPH